MANLHEIGELTLAWSPRRQYMQYLRRQLIWKVIPSCHDAFVVMWESVDARQRVYLDLFGTGHLTTTSSRAVTCLSLGTTSRPRKSPLIYTICSHVIWSRSLIALMLRTSFAVDGCHEVTMNLGHSSL